MRPTGHLTAQVGLAVLGVCGCAAAAVWLFRCQWRQNKDAVLRRHTLERDARHEQDGGQSAVINEAYQATPALPSPSASGPSFHLPVAACAHACKRSCGCACGCAGVRINQGLQCAHPSGYFALPFCDTVPAAQTAATTPRREEEIAYVPDAVVQGSRAKASASVYVDTPLTRPRTDPPNGVTTTTFYTENPPRPTTGSPSAGNTASFYADTPITTAAADTAGYEVPHNDAATVDYSAPNDRAAAPQPKPKPATVTFSGYEVPLDGTAGVANSVPSTRGGAQVHHGLSA